MTWAEVFSTRIVDRRCSTMNSMVEQKRIRGRSPTGNLNIFLFRNYSRFGFDQSSVVRQSQRVALRSDSVPIATKVVRRDDRVATEDRRFLSFSDPQNSRRMFSDRSTFPSSWFTQNSTNPTAHRLSLIHI